MSSVYSENSENLKFLLNTGLVNLNSIDNFGDNVLNTACKYGSVDHINTIFGFIESHSNFSDNDVSTFFQHADKTGQTPFLQASAAGKIDTIYFLAGLELNGEKIVDTGMFCQIVRFMEMPNSR